MNTWKTTGEDVRGMVDGKEVSSQSTEQYAYATTQPRDLARIDDSIKELTATANSLISEGAKSIQFKWTQTSPSMGYIQITALR